MLPTSNLQVTNVRQGDEHVLTLKGSIDEFLQLPELDDPKIIRLDLGAVKAVNSIGLQRWHTWIKQWSGQAQMILQNCPPPVVRILNAVDIFSEASIRVESFYVPYFDSKSGEDKLVLYRLGQDYDAQGNVTVPQVKSDQGHLLELDVSEKSYFRFLQR